MWRFARRSPQKEFPIPQQQDDSPKLHDKLTPEKQHTQWTPVTPEGQKVFRNLPFMDTNQLIKNIAVLCREGIITNPYPLFFEDSTASILNLLANKVKLENKNNWTMKDMMELLVTATFQLTLDEQMFIALDYIVFYFTQQRIGQEKAHVQHVLEVFEGTEEDTPGAKRYDDLFVVSRFTYLLQQNRYGPDDIKEMFTDYKDRRNSEIGRQDETYKVRRFIELRKQKVFALVFLFGRRSDVLLWVYYFMRDKTLMSRKDSREAPPHVKQYESRIQLFQYFLTKNFQAPDAGIALGTWSPYFRVLIDHINNCPREILIVETIWSNPCHHDVYLRIALQNHAFYTGAVFEPSRKPESEIDILTKGTVENKRGENFLRMNDDVLYYKPSMILKKVTQPLYFQHDSQIPGPSLSLNDLTLPTLYQLHTNGKITSPIFRHSHTSVASKSYKCIAAGENIDSNNLENPSNFHLTLLILNTKEKTLNINNTTYLRQNEDIDTPNKAFLPGIYVKLGKMCENYSNANGTINVPRKFVVDLPPQISIHNNELTYCFLIRIKDSTQPTKTFEEKDITSVPWTIILKTSRVNEKIFPPMTKELDKFILSCTSGECVRIINLYKVVQKTNTLDSSFENGDYFTSRILPLLPSENQRAQSSIAQLSA